MAKCLCGVDFEPRQTGGKQQQFCSERCANRVRKQRNRDTVNSNRDMMTSKPDILFYSGLNEKYWNHHTVEPGEYVCIAPVTSVTKEDKVTGEKSRRLVRTQVLIDETKIKHIMEDSGAFSDGIELKDGKVVKNNRLSFDHALQRQIAHAYEFRYARLVESLVSYDLLIDEVWQDGERSKDRWSVDAAEFAVQETIQAARYLDTQRLRIDQAFGHHVRLVLSAQGVEAEQYARCAEAIVKVMKSDDIFGLGGWCITGLRRHAMLPAAALILPGVFEVIGRANVKRVHVFGVIIPKLLGFLLYLCDRYGIQLSTDSAGPCVEPARNGNWGYGSWTEPKYKKPFSLESCRVLDEQGNKAPTCVAGTHCAGMERIRHVTLTRKWLANFREREPDLVTHLPIPRPPIASYVSTLFDFLGKDTDERTDDIA
jgi:hypothetical protein